MSSIGLIHYVIVSIALASAGLATLLTKRNAIGILIGVELILNAAAVNFVAFHQFQPWVRLGAGGIIGGGAEVEGQAGAGSIFTLFIIVLAAAEAAVALAIILNYYHRFGSIDVEQAQSLKG